MFKFGLKPIVVIILIVLIFVLLNVYFIKGRISLNINIFKNINSLVFDKLSFFRNFLSEFKKLQRLAGENIQLKNDNTDLIHRIAQLENLASENSFLKSLAVLSQKINKENLLYANIFNSSLTPGNYNFLLNKGSKDGISVNDIVVSETGVLIGRIKEVFPGFSKVLVVADPEFKITAKVLNSETTGIARGALNEGMYLDLIVQNEEIKEGDVIVSSGDDLYPPALILGKVSYIDVGEAQVFKKVRIKPEFDNMPFGRVVIIKAE